MRKPYFSIALFLIALFNAFPLFLEGVRAPDRTVRVPMRDGAELAADIYLPENGEEALKDPQFQGFPTLLVRSAAGRQALSALAIIDYTQEGYLVVIQESRSAADPDGKTMPYIHDGWGKSQDGYDTVEWLAKYPLSNGKIGTIGASTLGITQLMSAPVHHDALVAQYIIFACGSIYHHAAYPQGQLHKHQIESWLSYYAKDPCNLDAVKRNRLYGEFWEQFDSNKEAARVQVPALFVAGWFDTFLEGSIDSFQARQHHGGQGARGEQKLVIGPWAHFWPAVKTIGDYEVPNEGYAPPFDISPSRWFAHFLKGEKNSVQQIPNVSYYVMGPFDGTPSKGNRWKTAESWPVPSEKRELFLTSNGSLSSALPAEKESTLSYLYDPENPCPTLGGNNLFLTSGPVDQRALEERADVLVFTTEPLEEDLEVTGELVAKIFVSTNCEDTDWAARLSDVYPDGKSLLVNDQLVRHGILSSEGEPASQKGLTQPHEVEVKLHPMSLVFAKGHRIRLTLSSSNYPRYEKSLNVPHDENGDPVAPAQKAHNCLHVGSRTPSRLILPVVVSP